MRPFQILEPFFHALNDGKLIRFVVASVLRVFAGLAALGGLMWFVIFAGAAFTGSDFGTILGSLLFAILWLVSAFLQTGILLYRAKTVSELGDSPFTVTSIVSVFCRLIGEEFFVFFSLLGVGGCLFMWLANGDPLSRLGLLGALVPSMPRVGSGGGILGGLLFLIFMAVCAFFSIVVFYALAELTVVLVDIARNIHAVRVALASAGQPPAAAFAAAAGGAPRSVAPIGSPSHCPACGNPWEPGSVFCGNCGAGVRG